MEASGAGLGQGDAGQQGGDGEGQQQGGFGQAEFGQLNQTLQAIGQGQEGLRELLQNQLAGQQQEGGEGEGDDGLGEIDLSFLDPASVGFDPAQIGPQLQQVIRDQATAQAQQIIQQQLNPVTERFDAFERNQQLSDLAAEFPELTQEENARQVFGLARQVTDAFGWGEQMAGDPRFVRILYLAGRAADAHNEEEAQGGQPGAALLEGGGGARPSGVGQGQDMGELITGGGGRRGAGALPFG